jgi:hypothetical protein
MGTEFERSGCPVMLVTMEVEYPPDCSLLFRVLRLLSGGEDKKGETIRRGLNFVLYGKKFYLVFTSSSSL